MKTLLRNVYLYIFGIPALTFVALMTAQTPTDWINLVARVAVSVLVAYIAGRYIWRAVALVRDGNTAPEAFNVIGWSTFLLAYIIQTLWGAVFIAMDRPLWMSSLYINSALVVLACVGAGMVAWSIPRVGIFPTEQKGVMNAALLIIGAGLMFVVSHIPQAVTIIKNMFMGFAHAL